MINQDQVHIDFFKNLQGEDKLSPCWLLKGERYIGKADFALKLAKELLYASEIQNHGIPNSLIDKQIEQGIYPNFLYITRPILEDGSQAREINAENAKLVKKFLQKKSAIMGWRVVVVNSIDDMNRFAANSLLKILEEPPSKTLILLVCHQLGNILPTIRSRCKILNLTGKPHFLEDEALFCEKLIHFLDVYLNNRSSSLESLLKELVEKDKTLFVVRYLLLKLINTWIKDVASRPSFFGVFSKERWVNIYENVNQFFIEQDQAHLDPTQALTVVFLSFKNS